MSDEGSGAEGEAKAVPRCQRQVHQVQVGLIQ
jgi:hypothetical protein